MDNVCIVQAARDRQFLQLAASGMGQPSTNRPLRSELSDKVIPVNHKPESSLRKMTGTILITRRTWKLVSSRNSLGVGRQDGVRDLGNRIEGDQEPRS